MDRGGGKLLDERADGGGLGVRRNKQLGPAFPVVGELLRGCGVDTLGESRDGLLVEAEDIAEVAVGDEQFHRAGTGLGGWVDAKAGEPGLSRAPGTQVEGEVVREDVWEDGGECQELVDDFAGSVLDGELA